MSEAENGAVETGTPAEAEATTEANTEVTNEASTEQGSASEQASTLPEVFAALEGDTREHVLTKGFKTYDDVLKHSLEAEKMVSSTQRVPDKDAAPEKMTEFFSQFAPEDAAEGYSFTQPELEEGQFYNDDFANEFKGFAKEAGLHPNQAAILHDKVVPYLVSQQEGQQQAVGDIMDKQTDLLVEKWGDKDGETYQKNVEAATSAIKQMGDEFHQGLIESNIISPDGEVMNASVIMGLANLSSVLAQGNIEGESAPVVEDVFFQKENGKWDYHPDKLGALIKADPERAKMQAEKAGFPPSRFGL